MQGPTQGGGAKIVTLADIGSGIKVARFALALVLGIESEISEQVTETGLAKGRA